MLKPITAFIIICTLSASAMAQEASIQQEIQNLKKQNQIQSEKLELIKAQTDKLIAQRPSPSGASDTQIGGYGEIIYNHYLKDKSRNQMDLRRFVMSLGHRFNDDISFVGEMEWEHAVASATDKGEVAIEQAYLNWRLADKLSLKTGLFLMPFGFLNENHEPPVFYGVERNEVETRIIPSTWREGGIGLFGKTDSGIDYSLGAVTSFDLPKLDDASAPLAAAHQELQMAKAKDIGLYGALNYKLPGFVVGGSLFSGKSTQGDADFNTKSASTAKPSFAGINGRVTLTDIHTSWTQNNWDLQAIFAKGFVGDSAQFNDAIATFNNANTTSPHPFIPSEFYGWLAQAAYRFSVGRVATLSPFLRYEEYNTQSKMSKGIDSDTANRDRVTTIGVSYHPEQRVVVKADYRAYATNSGNSRMNLGIGYMF
jgi:hypothetical protein